jgi:hypothetical protein
LTISEFHRDKDVKDRIIRKRTGIEQVEWEQVRELMPRRQATRGIQYEALEYLFDHLYEKVSEEQLREHFLKVKGRLQEKGDPVKSAINLAIKELQRLSRPTFELIKIQEASLVGKTRRYVQLNFTGFDSVVDYPRFQSYLNDLLAGEALPVLRSIYNHPPHSEPTIFPGIRAEWLQRIRAFAMISAACQVDKHFPKTQYFIIPESHSNQNLLLLYESEHSELPFLAFVSDCTAVSAIEESRFLLYRGEEKGARLEFYHRLWYSLQQSALTLEEAAEIWETASRLAITVAGIDETTLRKGLLATQVRKKWEQQVRLSSLGAGNPT